MYSLEEKRFISDVVAKQADIIYKKVLIFIAVAGGSWLYGIKTEGYIGFVIWFVFILSTIGLIFNLTNMGMMYKELEDLKNG